jgi:hypothetical protein
MNGGDARGCECPEFASGLPCGMTPKWLVQVGTRKADAQFCCGAHLNRTCDLMYQAEQPRKPVLTVTAVKP